MSAADLVVAPLLSGPRTPHPRSKENYTGGARRTHCSDQPSSFYSSAKQEEANQFSRDRARGTEKPSLELALRGCWNLSRGHIPLLHNSFRKSYHRLNRPHTSGNYRSTGSPPPPRDMEWYGELCKYIDSQRARVGRFHFYPLGFHSISTIEAILPSNSTTTEGSVATGSTSANGCPAYGSAPLAPGCADGNQPDCPILPA